MSSNFPLYYAGFNSKVNRVATSCCSGETNSLFLTSYCNDGQSMCHLIVIYYTTHSTVKL